MDLIKAALLLSAAGSSVLLLWQMGHWAKAKSSELSEQQLKAMESEKNHLQKLDLQRKLQNRFHKTVERAIQSRPASLVPLALKEEKTERMQANREYFLRVEYANPSLLVDEKPCKDGAVQITLNVWRELPLIADYYPDDPTMSYPCEVELTEGNVAVLLRDLEEFIRDFTPPKKAA